MNASANFLDNLINNHYSNYQDLPMLLSVFDLNSQLRFATKYAQQFYNCPNYKHEEFSLKRHLTENFPHLRDRIEERFHLLQRAIDAKSVVTIIHFDQLGDKIGTLHTMFTPLVDQQQNVQGVVSLSYDFTAYFFGITHSQLSTHKADLTKLTKSQQDVLFLLALNLTQTQIANLLGVSRGTVSTHLTRIIQKLNIGSSSKHILFNKIDRSEVLKTLAMPKVSASTRNDVLPASLIYQMLHPNLG